MVKKKTPPEYGESPYDEGIVSEIPAEIEMLTGWIYSLSTV